MLKKKNIKAFNKRIKEHIQQSLSPYANQIASTYDHTTITYDIEQEPIIIRRLKQIPGIFNFSVVHVTKPELEAIIDEAAHLLNGHLKSDGIRFKVETKRTDKAFPMTSLDVSKACASPILKKVNHSVVVDVKNPEVTLNIDIRKEEAYVFLDSLSAMGGFPYGSAGKGLLLMSGGIDSPVAAYLAIKQGLDLEFLHFESTPMTPIESVQKVVDLTSKLAVYSPQRSVKLHLVPFREIHEAILNHVFEPYSITIMRRMMFRIAESFAKRTKCLVLVTGESICQVASQTLQSLNVIESVTRIPIIRPLITYDKLDIIRLSDMLETYALSIQPFSDCCSVYVPKSPVTRPIEPLAKKYEKSFDYESLVNRAVDGITTWTIHETTNMTLSDKGFTVSEVEENIKKETP